MAALMFVTEGSSDCDSTAGCAVEIDEVVVIGTFQSFVISSV